MDQFICMCLLLRRENDTDVWKNNGCSTVNFNNGSVMCSCDHLTHFAIILSPGTQVCVLANKRNLIT